MVLPPVGVAPGGAVSPLEGVLRPDVVGPDPGVLCVPRGVGDQGVLLSRGDGHQLPGVRAGAGQAGSLPGSLRRMINTRTVDFGDDEPFQ